MSVCTQCAHFLLSSLLGAAGFSGGNSDLRITVVVCIAGNKIQFVLWCPDNAPVKPRMTYASSKDALLKKLDGATAVALEAHEPSDLDALA